MHHQRPNPRTPAAISIRLLRELVPVVITLAVYVIVQHQTATRSGPAIDNAQALIAAERALGLFLEPHLQAWALDHAWQIPLWNAIYFWGHVPVIGALAGWLLWRHWETYAVMRNAFLLSALLAITCSALYPVVPPRLLPDYGFVDTIAQAGAASYQEQSMQSWVNPHAAMPSLHLGWAMLCGIALARVQPSGWGRLLGTLLPAAMALAIVLTGNHFLLDGVAGIALCLAALLLAHGWVGTQAAIQKARIRLGRAVRVPIGPGLPGDGPPFARPHPAPEHL